MAPTAIAPASGSSSSSSSSSIASNVSSITTAINEAPLWVKVAGGVALAGAVGAGLYYLLASDSSSTPDHQAAAMAGVSASSSNDAADISTVDDRDTTPKPEGSVQAQAAELKKQGNNLYSKHKYEEAIEVYTKAIQLVKDVKDSDLPVYYCNRSACYLFQKKYAQVIADCDEAIRLRPQYQKAYSRRAQAYENLGKRREAMIDYMVLVFMSNFQDEAADNALDRLLKETVALELKTFVANREKRLPSLYQIKTFLDAFEIDNMTREPETAAALLPMVVQDPRNGDVILRLANAFLNEGRYEQAYTNYCKAAAALEEMDLEPAERKMRALEAHTMKGLFNLLRGDPIEAEKDLRRALSFGKKNSSTLTRLAACKMEQNDRAEAMTIFQKAQDADPTNPMIYLQRGQAYLMASEFDKALTDFERAVELQPRGYTVYVHLGLLHFQMENQAKAMKAFKNALNRFPTVSLLHSYYAELLMHSDKIDEAEKEFNLAMELDPQNAPALVNMGMLCLRKNDMQKCVEYLDKALQIDPKCEAAHARKGQLLTQQGQFQEAIAAYTKAADYSSNIPELSTYLQCREALQVQKTVFEKFPAFAVTAAAAGRL